MKSHNESNYPSKWKKEVLHQVEPRIWRLEVGQVIEMDPWKGEHCSSFSCPGGAEEGDGGVDQDGNGGIPCWMIKIKIDYRDDRKSRQSFFGDNNYFTV